MAKGDPPRNAKEVGEQLRGLFDRVTSVDEEISNLKLDRKDVLNEAKSLGFDTKIMQRVMRLRRMERGQRFEERAMEEVYLSAIGEGDGALSDAARQFLAGRRGDDDKGDDDDGSDHDALPTIGDGKAVPKPDVSDDFGAVSDKPAVITIEDAKKLGAAAAAAGKPVTANPFPLATNAAGHGMRRGAGRSAATAWTFRPSCARAARASLATSPAATAPRPAIRPAAMTERTTKT